VPRKKKRAVRGTTRAGTRANAPSRYAWHRRVPWVAVGPGRFTGPGGGIGDHRTDGVAIAYPSYPPTSGAHWPASTTWGFHSEPVPDERAVHNLEHGGVVASYNNIPAESLAALQALLTTYPNDKYNQVKLVIRPYDKIPSGTIVLTAWEWILELPAYDEAQVRAFMDARLNQCCEDVP
jgi:hypothetical protein